MQKPILKESPGESARDPVKGCVSRLEIRAFRNYELARYEPDEGLNLIAGLNAQGKTNLLEAVYLAGTSRLLRGARDADAIRHEEHEAYLACKACDLGTLIEVRLFRGARKTVHVNGNRLVRASDVMGRLPCVCVSSADMALVKDEPADRRAFLDVELCQIYAGYLNVLAVYRKAQEQRNALLKAIGTRSVGPSEFEPWEDQMAESGHAVRAYRRSFVERLAPCCAEAHAFMGAGESLGVAYAPRDACDTPAALRELYAERRSEEIERGTTLVGPHRDDLSVSIDQRDARAYGSQGQQRTAVVALKLAALQVYASLGIVPVLLLDDILSDLDEGRRERLVEWVVGYGGQVFLTCTEPSAAGRSALSRAKVVEIRAGEIIER